MINEIEDGMGCAGIVASVGESELDQLRRFREQCASSLDHVGRVNDAMRAAIHAAHGLLAPLGNQVTPNVLAIREALQILGRYL